MSRSSQHSEPITKSLDLGRKGEEIAAAHLQQLGFQIVVANLIVPVGRNRNDAIVNAEIDLVAYEGPMLCFVEVKTRTSNWFASPTANVDLRKQRQIIRAARVYRRIFGLADEQYRYDVVSIVRPGDPTTDRAGVKKEEAANQITAPARIDLQIELLRGYWTEEKFRQRRQYQSYWD